MIDPVESLPSDGSEGELERKAPDMLPKELTLPERKYEYGELGKLMLPVYEPLQESAVPLELICSTALDTLL